MVYENLYPEFKKMFPEDDDYFAKEEAKHYVEEGDNPHIPFGSVVVPYVRNLLRNNETEKLKKFFNFVEEMDKDKDHRVSEVAEFTVLAELSDHSEDLEKMKQYLGPESRASLHAMAWWLNIDA